MKTPSHSYRINDISTGGFAVKVTAVLLVALASVLDYSAGSAETSPSSTRSAAVETVKTITGKKDGGSGSDPAASEQKTVHPYKDRQTPDSLSGWVDYLIYLPLYKTGGEWIRLKGLVTALIILVAGSWLSAVTGRLLKGAMMRFKSLPEHIAIAFSKIVVYFLIFFVILATVLVAGMPFSIVSVMGAMILIGASLGAKNTIYDYLSGLVLAIEQPVRIHDCIEVEDQAGFVDEIRGRYTRVRRFDGIDVLVPNSKFLEEEVVNWTLSDARIRGEFKIGVRYSSDVDETMDILIACMEDNKEVLSEPPSSVLFWEFGDNSLIFRMFFWIEAENPLEVWSVESKLRRESFKRLKESGIAVAFPQRDVHLDSSAPVTVVLDSSGDDPQRPGDDGQRQNHRGGDQQRNNGKRTQGTEEKRKESEQVAEPESSKNEGDGHDEDKSNASSGRE